MVTVGSGNSFKDRTFTDFDIDPLTLDAEGNEKVLDLIEENNTLTHEVPTHSSAADAAALLSPCIVVKRMALKRLKRCPHLSRCQCACCSRLHCLVLVENL